MRPTIILRADLTPCVNILYSDASVSLHECHACEHRQIRFKERFIACGRPLQRSALRPTFASTQCVTWTPQFLILLCFGRSLWDDLVHGGCDKYTKTI
eukprot:scaffold138934_cov47-Prasinocladus_malaysianus.AAC.2